MADERVTHDSGITVPAHEWLAMHDRVAELESEVSLYRAALEEIAEYKPGYYGSVGYEVLRDKAQDALKREQLAMPTTNEGEMTPLTDLLATPQRTSRDRDRLKGRRVCIDGRMGTIRSSYIWGRNGSGPQAEAPSLRVLVAFDDYRERWEAFRAAGGYKQPRTPERVPNPVYEERIEDWSDDYLLPAPEISAPVRVRQVLFRGHKDQVAQRWATLRPLTPDQMEAGYDRYIEFKPDVAAYRRWRIVTVAPPMDSAKVAETPDEHPRAASERRNRRDYGYDETDRYGY